MSETGGSVAGLAQARRRLGLTQATVAAVLGTTPGTVSRLERAGAERPDAARLVAVLVGLSARPDAAAVGAQIRAAEREGGGLRALWVALGAWIR